MSNLDPIEGQLDAMLTDLVLHRWQLRAYSPLYQWQTWIRTV